MCQQRARQQLLNIPPPRFTPVSPYPQYTQFQLDMRRKAEILQYNSNNTNTKTNNLTKAEKYSMLMNNPPVLSATTIAQIRARDCPEDRFKPTPSSSCDVPGPPITLFYDPAIILYNYQSQIVRSYGVENSLNPTNPWNTFSTTDISMSSLTSVPKPAYYPLFTIAFTNICKQGQTIYAFTAPMQLLMNGVATANVLQTGRFNVTFQLTSLFIDVYYNSTLMSTSDPSQKGASLSGLAILETLQRTSVTVEVTNKEPFSIVFYLGLLRASNMLISTYPGFIYDVRLRPSFAIIPASGADVSKVSAVLLANCSTGLTHADGCTLLSPTSTDPFTPLVFN
jgi:hypothetical protein